MLSLQASPGTKPGQHARPDFAELMACSRFPGDIRIVAFAGTIAQALSRPGRGPLIRGLSEDRFARLMCTCFPGITLVNGGPSGNEGSNDEFDDLLNLLLDYRANACEISDWLSCCIASAAMQENHLWQDMGLPNRAVLSSLLTENFPKLALANAGDMKWKKFFYRQLCQRAGIALCKSPNCADCTDFSVCFGPETARPLEAARMLFAVS